MLTLRFQRVGKKHDATFRIVAVDSRFSANSGKAKEILGWWDPRINKFELKKERILYWLGQGAQPSDSCYNLLIRAKIIEGKKRPITIRKKKEKKGKAEIPEKTEQTQPTEEKLAEKEKEKPSEEKPVEAKSEDKVEEKPIEETKDKVKPGEKPEEKVEEKRKKKEKKEKKEEIKVKEEVKEEPKTEEVKEEAKKDIKKKAEKEEAPEEKSEEKSETLEIKEGSASK